MMFTAHKSADNRLQSVKSHLENTAVFAEKNAVDPFKSIAYCAGMGHDIGKYTASFQDRINGSSIHAEHSVHGAAEYEKILDGNNIVLPLLEYCIAGHHSGLPDGGTQTDLPDKSTLYGRLRRTLEAYDAYKNDIELSQPDISSFVRYFNDISKSDKSKTEKYSELIETYAFFTKYIFSCLTDADFIDTEQFCNPECERGLDGNFIKALDILNQKFGQFKSDTNVRKARAELLRQAVANISNMAEINLLNMPTGSGKTLCSLKLALEKAVRENKKRIIYVIPYTSIIEQTSNVFCEILENSVDILQHHSNYNFDDNVNEDDSTLQKMKRSCENWDAKIIVTTSVQFFQSLYHYKGSRLRKLHNMADSVIVFDEIHLIPAEYLQPCLRGVGYITKYLNSTAIFLSATMPDYSLLFEKFMLGNTICELINEKSCFSSFRTCGYINLGHTDFKSVAEKAQESESSLIIVNSRKSARYVYNLLTGRKFHLSTYMCPEHRSKVIAEIRECLKNHERITVVSTSLVEAGVDFDFQTVFRQLAGLDSILQSGGRCNREGLRSGSTVYIFETDDVPKGDIAIRANITSSIIKEYDDISSPECIKDYYGRLFGFSNEKIMKNSIASLNGCVNIKSIPFRTYAESFEYIKSDTIGIAINYDKKSTDLIEQLKYGNLSVKRKLQKYTVSVYVFELEDMLKLGIIKEYNGVFVLENNSYYSVEKGLVWQENTDENYIC